MRQDILLPGSALVLVGLIHDMTKESSKAMGELNKTYYQGLTDMTSAQLSYYCLSPTQHPLGVPSPT